MSTTRTGTLPIGFRTVGSDWQREIGSVITFARENHFEAVDVRGRDVAELKQIVEAGLTIGSVDALRWADLASPDGGKRRDAANENIEMMRAALPLGVKNFFAVAIPEEIDAPRQENFARVVDGYGQVCEALDTLGGQIVLEGWPGPANSALACTPADLRALLEELPRGLGINFDPSHLIRMGIDPIRFLDEFGDAIHHVHAKDTEILEEALYEHGNLQAATFANQHHFGGFSWRYTIPGHGCARWGKMLSRLRDLGYGGVISIELEDEEFNGNEAGERRGLVASRSFLEDA